MAGEVGYFSPEPHRPSIERSFRDLSQAEVADIEKAFALARIGWAETFGWNELLRSHRVLIVSEAGAGKTYECRAQQAKLWEAGEPAFFLELATLLEAQSGKCSAATKKSGSTRGCALNLVSRPFSWIPSTN